MNIAGINNSDCTTFKGIKVIGKVPENIKKMIYDSALNNYNMDLVAIASSCKTGAYDFNHEAGTKLYKFKIAKVPENAFQKFLYKIGLINGVNLTDNYHSEVGLRRALNDWHISNILERLA